jgi:deoxyribose-phosphate aldolase
MLDSINQVIVDKSGIDERVKRFTQRSIKADTKSNLLNLSLSMIDLTTLEGSDTAEKVQQLCYKAKHLDSSLDNIPNVAAVCVYPNLVSIAKKELKESNIKVASVSTSFPSGQSSLKVKIADTIIALDSGADEIDMVISRGKFLKGEYNFVYDEIAQIKDLCGKTHLKVILETGEIGNLESVRIASDIAISAGADFIKTSTGKLSNSSNMPVVLVMMYAVRDYYIRTGKKIGIKPAGGISNSKQALQYLVMLNEVLGYEWMSKELFRFGASRLANDILMQLKKLDTNIYQSLNYFSND